MSEEIRNNARFRVGLLGAGYISEFHIAALQRVPNASVVGIADVDVERARKLAARFRVPDACDSLRKLVERGANVIHVLTPPATHADCVIEAIKNGCDVLVEKPLATNVDDCHQIEAAAAAAGKSVCVNHSNLRDPFVARAIKLARQGLIGEVIGADYFRSSNYPPYRGGRLPPQYVAGGYPFRDMGVHGLYLLQAILGDIKHVSAQFATHGGDPNLLFDEWSAQVHCKQGLGRLRLSWNVRPLTNQLVIEGTRGVIRADMFAMYVTTRRNTRLPSSASRILNALREAGEIATQVSANVVRVATGRIRRFHGLQEMVAEFYEHLAHGQSMPVTVADAKPIVHWTETIAEEADRAKAQRRNVDPISPSPRLLVTGANGFIGRHLVERLLGEWQSVRLLVRSEPKEHWRGHPWVEIAYGDLGDPGAVDQAMRGINTVFHVGAAMRGSAHDFDRGTVVGTQNIIDSALRHKVSRLVYVSSLSVLHASRATSHDVVREDWPLEPFADARGIYSKSKLQAEQLVVRAVKQDRLPAVILRPGQVIGAGGQLLTPAVALKLRRTLTVIGNGQVPLPLVHVADVVDAMMLCLSADVFDGSVFHLIDETRITQNDVAHLLAQRSDEACTVRHVPRWIMNVLAAGVQAAFWCLVRNPPLSPYRLRSALSKMQFDCQKARERLGWQPKVGVRAAFAEVLEEAPIPLDRSPPQASLKPAQSIRSPHDDREHRVFPATDKAEPKEVIRA
jgi:predicted dehydrogenase/nucleoside-diphosphate-sugar epimerase